MLIDDDPSHGVELAARRPLQCRAAKEVIAESVSYIVLGHFGIDTGDYSFGYLLTWDTDDGKQFRQELGQIQKVASTIIERLEEAKR